MNAQIETAQKFVAHVVYEQPSLEELKRRFPHFAPMYGSRRLNPIGRLQSISAESRDVTFEYFRMGRDATHDQALAQMHRNGLFPALYEEGLGFAETYPCEQLKYQIAVIGSGVTLDLGGRHVPYLCSIDGERMLDLYCVDEEYWDSDVLFLAVRK